MYYPYKIVMKVKDSNNNVKVYEDYGREVDESLFVRTAKRILNDMAKVESDKFVAKGFEHLSIDMVPSEIKKGWPVGLKSILVYNYEYESC